MSPCLVAAGDEVIAVGNAHGKPTINNLDLKGQFNLSVHFGVETRLTTRSVGVPPAINSHACGVKPGYLLSSISSRRNRDVVTCE